MDRKISENNYSPTILIVRDSGEKIEFDSSILADFNTVYVSKSKDRSILGWIQENQPDLIILELRNPQESCCCLITPLRLDWLTRNIPIIVIGDRFTLKSIANLDYDVCLRSPCSETDLDGAICSLISTSLCQTHVS
ncbi:MAG: two-component system response regulator [Pleurocapsa sp.]